MYLACSKHGLNYTILLQGEKLQIKAVNSTFKSWFATTGVIHPLGTERHIAASSLFDALRNGLAGNDPDITLEFPTRPNKESILALKIWIKQRFLPADEITIHLIPKESSEMSQLQEMILAQGRFIEAQGKIAKSQEKVIEAHERAIKMLESVVERRVGFIGLDDSAFSCSSFWENSSMCSASAGRLNNMRGSKGWCAGSTLNQWIQADLGGVKGIFAVSTQGRGNGVERVTKYRLCGSLDGSTFVDIGEFSGNTDDCSVVSHRLSDVVQYRFVRLVPLGYNGYVSLRWDVHYE